MSLNTAEGNFAFVIWSNEYLDWADWHEAFEEVYSDAPEEKKYQLMSECNAEYLEDARQESKRKTSPRLELRVRA